MCEYVLPHVYKAYDASHVYKAYDASTHATMYVSSLRGLLFSERVCSRRAAVLVLKTASIQASLRLY
jgi:hypothetical protein